MRQARFFGGDCRERRDDAGARNPRRCVGRTLLVKACARTTAGSHISREREGTSVSVVVLGGGVLPVCVCVCVAPERRGAPCDDVRLSLCVADVTDHGYMDHVVVDASGRARAQTKQSWLGNACPS